jgi:hypothetical protein
MHTMSHHHTYCVASSYRSIHSAPVPAAESIRSRVVLLESLHDVALENAPERVEQLAARQDRDTVFEGLRNDRYQAPLQLLDLALNVVEVGVERVRHCILCVGVCVCLCVCVCVLYYVTSSRQKATEGETERPPMSHHHTYYVTSSRQKATEGETKRLSMSHHHTYYVTSSYILCHIIIHTMSHHQDRRQQKERLRDLRCHIIIHTMSHHQDRRRQKERLRDLRCHIIIHTMSHHHTYYVTSSSCILCHIIMPTMSHHHTYYVTSSYILCHIIKTEGDRRRD